MVVDRGSTVKGQNCNFFFLIGDFRAFVYAALGGKH